MMRNKTWLLIAAALMLIFLPAASWAQDVTAIFNQSKQYQVAKMYREAQATAQQVVDLEPSNDVYQDWLGWCQFLNADYANGIASCNRAIRLNPTGGGHYVVLGYNCEGAGKLDEAKKNLSIAVSAGPEYISYSQHQEAINELSHLRDRTWKFTWFINPQDSNLKLDNQAYVIPLPTRVPYQSYTYQVQGALATREIEKIGNPFLRIAPQPDKHQISITFTVNLVAYSYQTILDQEPSAAANIPADVLLFLGKSDRIDPLNPLIHSIVGQLPGTSDPRQRVRAILSWLSAYIRYQLPYNEVPADQIVQNGYAECGGFSILATALCRASGIPAREVWYIVDDHKKAGCLKGHVEIEFWYNGTWIPVEPQSPESLGIRKPDEIRISHRDTVSNWQNETILLSGGDTPPFKEVQPTSVANTSH